MESTQIHWRGINLALKIEEIIQKEIDEENNFLLSGGAGSGKTFTLMQVLDQIMRNNPLASVACITFTNVAAKEIRELINSKAKIDESVCVFDIKDLKQLCKLSYLGRSFIKVLYFI